MWNQRTRPHQCLLEKSDADYSRENLALSWLQSTWRRFPAAIRTRQPQIRVLWLGPNHHQNSSPSTTQELLSRKRSSAPMPSTRPSKTSLARWIQALKRLLHFSIRTTRSKRSPWEWVTNSGRLSTKRHLTRTKYRPCFHRFPVSHSLSVAFSARSKLL